MDDIRLLVKIKNNALIKFRESKGMSGIDIARHCGFPEQYYYQMEDPLFDPFKKHTNELKIFVKKYMKFVDKPLEEMFPKSLKRIKKSRLERELNSAHCNELMYNYAQVKALPLDEAYDKVELNQAMNDVLKTLTPKEETIIRKRFFDGETYTEIGEDFDVTSARIKQIEERAINKMKRKTRSARLEEYKEMR